MLYYSGSYSRVFALDGATGQVKWTFFPKLDDDLVAAQTHSPYNRGIALGHGKVFVGTVDGRLIALDMATGKQAWDTKLIDSKKLTVGFTGAPLVVKDKVIIGAQGGEWPGRGPIFGVDANTGEKKWEFFTVAGTEEAKATWGGDSWRTGGGGGWMPGTYDAQTNTVWWGTGNPAPLYDWAGPKWKTEGPRPGDNLYTTSVIGLDPDTGKLKFYHQELPHDAWDFDSSVGEFVMIERDGRNLMVHPNKGGFVFVYDRSNGKVENVWRLVQNINFVKDIDPKTGELIGRRDMVEGAHKNLCPAIAGGISWNSGTYNPQTGLYYKVGQEWCMDLDVVKTTPILEPMAQLNIGANFKLTNPEGGKAHGHVSARDPITGAEEVGGEVRRAAAGQPALHRRQPGVRAGCARHAARLQRDHRRGTVVAQQRQWPQRRHHQLPCGRQAVHCRDDGLGIPGRRRVYRPVRRTLRQHGQRLRRDRRLRAAVEAWYRDEGGRARPRPAASVGFDQSHEPIRVSVDLRTGRGRDAARHRRPCTRGSADGGRGPARHADNSARGAAAGPVGRSEGQPPVRDIVRLVPSGWRPGCRPRSQARRHRQERRVHHPPDQAGQAARHAGFRQELQR